MKDKQRNTPQKDVAHVCAHGLLTGGGREQFSSLLEPSAGYFTLLLTPYYPNNCCRVVVVVVVCIQIASIGKCPCAPCAPVCNGYSLLHGLDIGTLTNAVSIARRLKWKIAQRCKRCIGKLLYKNEHTPCKESITPLTVRWVRFVRRIFLLRDIKSVIYINFNG